LWRRPCLLWRNVIGGNERKIVCANQPVWHWRHGKNLITLLELITFLVRYKLCSGFGWDSSVPRQDVQCLWAGNLPLVF
jgi:hypothetical protein